MSQTWEEWLSDMQDKYRDNPHIPASYFADLEAARERELLKLDGPELMVLDSNDAAVAD